MTLHFHKFRRQNDCSRARRGDVLRARRLAVEQMEDRLVLSTNVAELPASPPDSTTMTLLTAVERLEGGWIDLRGPKLSFAGDFNADSTGVDLAIYEHQLFSDFGDHRVLVVLPLNTASGVSYLFGLERSVDSFFFTDSAVSISDSEAYQGSALGVFRISRIDGSSPEGGEVQLEQLIAKKHPSVPQLGVDNIAIAQQSPAFKEVPLVPVRREITGARARDVAFEVAFVDGARAETNQRLGLDAESSQTLVAQAANGEDVAQWPGATIDGDDSATARAKSLFAAANETTASLVANRGLVVSITDPNSNDASDRAKESWAEAAEEAILAVPGPNASKLSPDLALVRLDDIEVGSEAEVAELRRDRDQVAKPWYVLLSLAAGTLIAERLSRRQAETELNPPRKPGAPGV